MVVKIRFRYSLLLYYCKLWILDFGFWIGGIASLYLLLKQAEHLKSKIRIPKSKIITLSQQSRQNAPQAAVHPGKPHKCHGQNSSDNQGDGRPLKRGGNVAQVKLFPDAGHDNNGDGKTGPAEDSQGQGAPQVPGFKGIVNPDDFAHNRQAGKQDGAIGRNQR